MKEKLAALLNNSVGFSINLFIFEISMDMLALQMNAYMCEFMYDAECSEILVFKLFPNGIIFISLSFHLHQILNKSIRLGRSDPKSDQKEITWAFELIVGFSTSLFLLNWFTLHPLALSSSGIGPYRSYTPRSKVTDSFCPFNICAMSWTRRRSSSFSS